MPRSNGRVVQVYRREDASRKEVESNHQSGAYSVIGSL